MSRYNGKRKNSIDWLGLLVQTVAGVVSGVISGMIIHWITK